MGMILGYIIHMMRILEGYWDDLWVIWGWCEDDMLVNEDEVWSDSFAVLQFCWPWRSFSCMISYLCCDSWMKRGLYEEMQVKWRWYHDEMQSCKSRLVTLLKIPPLQCITVSRSFPTVVHYCIKVKGSQVHQPDQLVRFTNISFPD